LKIAKKRTDIKLEAIEARREKEQVSRCKPMNPEKFQRGRQVLVNS
jgi:hypothetical protein